MQLFLSFLLLALLSCNQTNNFYQGKVMDEKSNPLEGVIVTEDHGKHTTTDKNGYFKLDRNQDWLGSLIFFKKGYTTDTVPTVSQQAGETTDYIFVKNDTTPVILKRTLSAEKLDLTITQPKAGKRDIPATWVSLSAIQKEWVEVKQDDSGYLIYEPCDGYTRSVSFKKGMLYIQWQMEPAYKFSIEKLTRITGNKSFRLDAYETLTQSGFPIFAKIIDYNNGLVLWQFNDEKWLMTPKQNAKYFRHIKNNCPGGKVREVDFIEPE